MTQHNNVPVGEIAAMNADAEETAFITTKIDSLECQTYLRKYEKIDHVAVSVGRSMIIVGRYEIPELVEYLQTVYKLNEDQ